MRPESDEYGTYNHTYVFYYPDSPQGAEHYMHRGTAYVNFDALPERIAERIAVLDAADFNCSILGVGIKRPTIVNESPAITGVKYSLWGFTEGAV